MENVAEISKIWHLIISRSVNYNTGQNSPDSSVNPFNLGV